MKKKENPKPGIRTKLNPGKKDSEKVTLNKTDDSKKEKNPTARAASVKLPEMELSNETDWTAESSSTIMLSAEKINPPTGLIPVDIKVPKRGKKPKTPKPKEDSTQTKNNNEIINPTPKKESKNIETSTRIDIITELKDRLATEISNTKSEYQKLANLPNELNKTLSEIKETTAERIDGIIDNTSKTVAAKNEEFDRIKQKIKDDIAAAKQKKQEKKNKEFDFGDLMQTELKNAEKERKTVLAELKNLKNKLKKSTEDNQNEIQEQIISKEKELESVTEKIKEFKINFSS